MKHTNSIQYFDIPNEKSTNFIGKQRSNTLGYQPKVLLNDINKFIKCQYSNHGVLYDDWKVEILAGIIGTQLGFSVLKQKHCLVKVSDNLPIMNGVLSDNFLKDDYMFISFKRLLEINNIEESIKYEFNALGAKDKFNWLINKMVLLTGINYKNCKRYFSEMVIIDILMANVDRHFHNFGFIYGKESSICPIFDSGLGLFCHNEDVMKGDLESALRYTYIEPYGEDPFDLLEIIETIGILSLVQGKTINVSELAFPTKIGIEYFKNVCEIMKITIVWSD